MQGPSEAASDMIVEGSMTLGGEDVTQIASGGARVRRSLESVDGGIEAVGKRRCERPQFVVFGSDSPITRTSGSQSQRRPRWIEHWGSWKMAILRR